LLAGLILYTWFTLRQARRANPEAVAAVGGSLPVAGAVATAKGPAPRRRSAAALGEGALALGGLAALVVGSRLLSGSAVAIAAMAGMSEAAIGLTIVAELATSLVAALRRQPDIAVGNVVGSNAFNCLGIAGAASLAAPLETAGVRALDYGVMVAFSVLLLPLLWTGLRLRRLEAGALLLGYVAYLWALWPK